MQLLSSHDKGQSMVIYHSSMKHATSDDNRKSMVIHCLCLKHASSVAIVS